MSVRASDPTGMWAALSGCRAAFAATLDSGYAAGMIGAREATVTHDQNFKNLIIDYPHESIQFFAADEAAEFDKQVRVTPVREQQLGEHFRELDVPLLLEWPDGRRAAILFVFEEESDRQRQADRHSGRGIHGAVASAGRQIRLSFRRSPSSSPRRRTGIIAAMVSACYAGGLHRRGPAVAAGLASGAASISQSSPSARSRRTVRQAHPEPRSARPENVEMQGLTLVPARPSCLPLAPGFVRQASASRPRDTTSWNVIASVTKLELRHQRNARSQMAPQVPP